MGITLPNWSDQDEEGPMVQSSAKNILATVPCNTREEAFSDELRESPESRFLLPTTVNRRLSARSAVFPEPQG
jgi:hypothetical protein